MVLPVFVIAYVIFLILMIFRKNQIREERQLVEKNNKYNCMDYTSPMNDSNFYKYDSSALMNHRILI